MHTFLSIDMNMIPQSTKDNVPTFWLGVFSKDYSRMLLDGKSNGNLVHSMETLRAWTQWSEDPEEVVRKLLYTAIEYTKLEILEEQQNPTSIWYIGDGHG